MTSVLPDPQAITSCARSWSASEATTSATAVAWYGRGVRITRTGMASPVPAASAPVQSMGLARRSSRRTQPVSGVISVARRAFAVRSAALVTISRRANRSGRKPRAVETSSQRRCERGSSRNLTWTPTRSPSSSSATRSIPRSVARMPAARRPGQSSHVHTRRIPRAGSWRRKWATTRSKASPRARSSASSRMRPSVWMKLSLTCPSSQSAGGCSGRYSSGMYRLALSVNTDPARM